MAILLGGMPAWAPAATPLGDYLTVGGFGTGGGVVTNSNEGQYGRDRQVGGADKHPALDVDSNLGLQIDAKATSWLSGTVQALTAKRESSAVSTRIEWAYVLVKPIDGLAIRGGRMATPAFLVSDSRNIGYANNWLRAPNEVYGLNIFRNFEGGDVTYRRAFGSISVSLTGLAGKSPFSIGPLTGTGDSLRGLNLQVETDWVSLRAGRLKADVSIPSIGTFGDPYTFTGYGATVDQGNVYAQAEYVTRRSSGQGDAVNSNAWYVMSGYRFGSVLPYAIYSRGAPQSPDFPIHVSNSQRTTALGLRWDAARSADIKLQLDRVKTSGTNGISFTTPTVPSAVPGPTINAPITGAVTVISLAVDFIF